MANRKNRKPVAKKFNNATGIQLREPETAPRTVTSQATAAKPITAPRVNEAVLGRSVPVGREIKRSAICAAIVLTAMAALYFVFK